MVRDYRKPTISFTPHSDGPTYRARQSRARHMHREQDEHTIDGAEPMRRVFRNENEISFCDGARRSAFNRRATEVRGICSSLLDELATRHQSRRSIDHVENLCLLFMDGGVANRGAIFEVPVVRSQLQHGFRDHCLAILMFAFRFSNKCGDLSRRGEILNWLLRRLRGGLLRQCCRSHESESETDHNSAHKTSKCDPSS